MAQMVEHIIIIGRSSVEQINNKDYDTLRINLRAKRMEYAMKSNDGTLNVVYTEILSDATINQCMTETF